MEIDVNRLLEEYEPINDIWSEEDENIDKFKRRIKQLPDADRIIFLLYCELASYRKVAKLLGVSHTLVSKEINRIKNSILYDLH